MYENLYQGLYFELYGMVFIAQLLISLLIFVIFLPRRNFFVMRVCISLCVYIMLVTVIWAIIRNLNDGVPNYNPVFFLSATLFLGIGVFACFKTNAFGALYYTTAAYAVQHAAYSVSNILMNLLNPEWHEFLRFLFFDVFIYLVVAALFFVLFIYAFRKKMSTCAYDVRVFVVSLCIMVVCVLLSYSFDKIFVGLLPLGVELKEIRIYCDIYAIIGCLASVIIQFSFQTENRLTSEKEMLNRLMNSEKKSHEMSKDVIDLINKKSHDLKHQLSVLEQLGDAKGLKNYTEELKDCLDIYDSIVETGNDALDIVISEKVLVCRKNDIAFSYIVDGKLLSFMNTVDIASLFGNALDNAIERQRFENADNRFINLSITKKNGFIYIHTDNYCSEEMEFEGGMPLTTKKKDGYHGFGTKSIGSIVDKYGGEVIMSIDDNVFNLDALIPDMGEE